ncbi:peroxin-2 [Kwoniella heveanensis BCC8398]|uniref:Peroxin-2 n=1 Tax=Kwoniella heveanensis BCC8398 TaxID=1296120 RepID=A0A1B9H0Q1_9TREE|nr:peroxin-2 [Kwoniella heveanensis BCC8398]
MAVPVRTVYAGESPSETSRAAALALSTAPRVNQIDADELDSALVGMLSERLGRSLDNFKSTFSLGFKPELELLIKLVLFRYGVLNSLVRSSPGAKLQNLKLASSRASHISRKALLLYLLLHPPIFPTYLLTRIKEYALSKQWPDLPNHDWRKKAWRVLGKVENGGRIWELISWVWFLFDGRHPSLLMRILGLRLVPSQPHLTRLVSYEFMNRQLVWGAFTEFAMFSVPLLPPVPSYLNPTALIAPIKSLLSQPPAIDYSSIPLVSSSSASVNIQQKHTGPYAGLPRSTCPICHIRYSSAPVPLDASTSQGSALSLTPITLSAGSSEAETGMMTEFGHGDDKEESRIFVPAQTDCRGNCQWCYYCIGEELYKHRERVKNEAAKQKTTTTKKKKMALDNGGIDGMHKQEREDEVAEKDKWECLRCGGCVTRAWRVTGQ